MEVAENDTTQALNRAVMYSQTLNGPM